MTIKSCEHDDGTRWVYMPDKNDPELACRVGKKIRPTCPFCKPSEVKQEPSQENDKCTLHLKTKCDYCEPFRLVEKKDDIKTQEKVNRATKSDFNEETLKKGYDAVWNYGKEPKICERCGHNKIGKPLMCGNEFCGKDAFDIAKLVVRNQTGTILCNETWIPIIKSALENYGADLNIQITSLNYQLEAERLKSEILEKELKHWRKRL